MSVPVEPHALYTEVMGSIEKPLSATLAFKYLSNDKPIQWLYRYCPSAFEGQSEVKKATIRASLRVALLKPCMSAGQKSPWMLNF